MAANGRLAVAELQAIIEKYTEKGLPCTVVEIKDKEGVWEGNSGFASLASKTRLSPGYVHAGGSSTKIYTATAIMKLQEQNKPALDKSISDYMTASVAFRISHDSTITVRIVLNHSSFFKRAAPATLFSLIQA